MQDTLPLSALDDMRDVAPYYLEWLRHPPEDPFWSFAELRGRYGATDAAVLNLSGWHDDNYGPEGATTNFRGLVDARGGQPARAALLIGPWVHGVDATARTRSGEREFGPAAAIDYDAVVLDWMDRHVRGLPTATGLASPVRYFVMGANRLGDGGELAAPGTSYALSAHAGGPGSCRHPGRWTSPRPPAASGTARRQRVRLGSRRSSTQRVRPRGRPRLPRAGRAP